MRSVDTNVLVRLITRDDARQTAAAEGFVAPGAWVSTLALAEAMWVLDAAYGRGAADIATAIDMLLNHQELTLQDADAVQSALASFRKRPALGFTDCLLVELSRKAGHLPLGTLDRSLAKIDGTQQL